MSYLRYAARMYDVPLLLTREKSRTLEQVIRAHEEGRAQLLSPSATTVPRRELAGPRFTRAEGGYLRTDTGAAIIQTIGTMVQRSGDEQLDAFSGLVAYSTIAQQMIAAEHDPRVDAVLWEIDSDGGEVSGLVDVVGRVRALAAKKPLWAIANEKAFSAGMWLASAASRLYVPTTGMVGSIGVRMLHVDQSQRDAKQGLVYTEIVAGERKADFSSHAPLSDAAYAVAQGEIDRIYGMFVAAVAGHRGIDEQLVRDTEAGLLNPSVALALGLIDGIQSFDETLAQLEAEAQHVRIHGMRAAATARIPAPSALLDEGVETMTDQERAAQAALIAEARAAGVTEGKTETAATAAKAAKAAADAERKRVSAIQTCEAATGKPALAAHLALETEMTVEQAQALLAKAAVETPAVPANALAERMAGIPNPKIGADGGNENEPKQVTVISANELFARRRKQAGHAA